MVVPQSMQTLHVPLRIILSPPQVLQTSPYRRSPFCLASSAGVSVSSGGAAGTESPRLNTICIGWVTVSAPGLTSSTGSRQRQSGGDCYQRIHLHTHERRGNRTGQRQQRTDGQIDPGS